MHAQSDLPVSSSKKEELTDILRNARQRRVQMDASIQQSLESFLSSLRLAEEKTNSGLSALHVELRKTRRQNCLIALCTVLCTVTCAIFLAVSVSQSRAQPTETPKEAQNIRLENARLQKQLERFEKLEIWPGKDPSKQFVTVPDDATPWVWNGRTIIEAKPRKD